MNGKKKRLSPLAIGLLLSLFLHTGTIVWTALPSFRQKPKPPPEPIEITSYPQSPPPTSPSKKADEIKKPKTQPKVKELEVAETEDSKTKEIDPNAKFLSDRNQKAVRQTRAKNVDAFRKKQGNGVKSSPQEGMAEPPPGGQIASDAPDQGLAGNNPSGAPKKKDWKKLSLKDLSVDPGAGGPTAASDDRLNGVEDGERTILSTREFRFFSYYHRIKEMLRQYWKPSVERKLARLWTKGKALQEDELVTKVLVLLDEKGTIQKISKVGTSGVEELDDAATDAFQRAAPFPNPPKGMVESDGFVRIRWDFILKTESAPRIQFRSVGNAAPY